jgi:elongation factor P--beta-lysine ligase
LPAIAVTSCPPCAGIAAGRGQLVSLVAVAASIVDHLWHSYRS